MPLTRTAYHRLEAEKLYGREGSQWDKYKSGQQWQPLQGQPLQVGQDIDDWRKNYKNSPVGPNGEKLPEGALGWNYYGDPDWGEGLSGWWNRMTHGWKASTDPSASDVPDLSRVFDGIDKDKGETYWNRVGENIGIFTGAIGAKWNQALSNPGAGGTVARVAGATSGGILEVFNAAAKGAERVLGTISGTAEDIGAGSSMPTFEDWSKNNAVGYVREWLPQWLQGLSLISPVRSVYNTIRAFDAPHKTWEEKKDIVQENWQAARIAYSWVADPAIKSEYLRLLKSGEYAGKEYLAAQELEMPWTEMVGQLVLDPLNAVGFATRALAKGKLFKGVGRIARAADEWEPVIKNADELIDSVRLVKGSQHADKLDELVKVTKLAVDEVGTAVDKAANTYNALADTAAGKRFHGARRMYETLMHINIHAPGDAQFEFVEALVKIASGKEDEIAEGLLTAGHYRAPRILLSRNAMETGIYMRNMLMDEAGDINYDKFLKNFAKYQDAIKAADDAADVEKIGQTTGAFVDYVASKSDDALKRIFPKAVDNQNASSLARLFGKAHDVASPKYQFVNRFFAGVYMGLSPGYAFRNALTNSIGVFADEGLRAMFSKVASNVDNMGRWKVSPAGLKTGFGGLHKGEGVADVLGQYESAWQALKGTKDNDKWYQTFTRLSEWFEYKASTRVMNKAVEDTMLNLLRPGRALPDTTRLAELGGLDQRTISGFVEAILMNGGDVKAARKWLVKSIDAGFVNRFQSGTWLTDDMRKIISQYFTREEAAALLKSGSKDDAIKAISQRRGEVFEETLKRLSQEVAPPPNNAEFKLLEAAAEEGIIDDVEIGLESDRFWAGKNAMDGGHDAIDSFLELLPQEQINALKKDPELVKYFSNYYQAQAQKTVQDAMNNAWAQTKRIKGYYKNVNGELVRVPGLPRTTNWDDVWREVGLPGNPPKNLNKQYIVDELWDAHTKPLRRSEWIAAREAEYELANRAVLRLEELTGENLQSNPLWGKYLQDMKLSRRYDNVIVDELGYKLDIRTQLRTAIERGKNDEAIRILAHQYAIGSISNTGSKYDSHILNVLSQYGIDAKKLQDVDLKSAMKAFEQRRLDKGWAPLFQDFIYDDLFANAKRLSKPKLFKPDKSKYYRSFYNPDEFLGTDVSVQKGGLFSQDGFMAEMSKKGKVSPVAHHPGSLRGDITNFSVEKIYYFPEEYSEDQARFSKYLADLRNRFPDAEFVKVGNGEVYGVGLPEDLAIIAEDSTDTIADIFTKGADPSPIPAPMTEGSPIHEARVAWESKEGIGKTFDDMVEAVKDNFGVMDEVTGKEDTIKIIDEWIDGWVDDAGKYHHGAEEGVAQSRATASVVANNARAFTLHDYPAKKNIDVALSYLMPYHFWYNRTYMKWFTQRIWRNPEIFAAYAKYKAAMAKAHAGMPEWWRYNINTNELLGIESDNPFFFNLEATLNPLNGLTGVDFNDPYKRVDWFTNMMDQVGKYGPSIWTPWSMALAYSLYLKGRDGIESTWDGKTIGSEEYQEAAARWAGRLVPQTALIKSLTKGLKPGGIELDLNVQLFAGGKEPYEVRRIQRALSALIEQNPDISEAELIDAALEQKGPLWDQAAAMAAEWRGPGQLTSYLFGVGFKARTQEDMQIDRFYQEYYRLWNQEPDLHPDEFRSLMEDLRTRYPFMDTLLISRKGGLARDRAFAYNVMARIPPGMSSGISKAVGISGDLLGKFYDEKGHIENWEKNDRDRFLVGIADIAAMLEVPDTATRYEWLEAKLHYGDMMEEAEKNFGSDITDLQDQYYQIKGDDQVSRDRASAFLSANPRLEMFMDWKTGQVMADPLLMAYYGGFDTLSGFYKGQMYDAIDTELGDMSDFWQEYHFLQYTDEEGFKAFKKQNKQKIDRYYDIRDDWQMRIDAALASMVGRLPEGIPAKPRESYEGPLFQAAQPEVPQLTYAQWQAYLGTSAVNALYSVYYGESIPDSVYPYLEKMAVQMGMTVEQMIESIVNSEK